MHLVKPQTTDLLSLVNLDEYSSTMCLDIGNLFLVHFFEIKKGFVYFITLLM